MSSSPPRSPDSSRKRKTKKAPAAAAAAAAAAALDDNSTPVVAGRRDSDHSLDLKKRAVALKAAGDTKGAKELLEKARELEFEFVTVEELNDPLKLKQYAIAKKKKGNMELAKQALEKATQLEIDSSNRDHSIRNNKSSQDHSTAASARRSPEQSSNSKQKKKRAGRTAGPTEPGAFAAAPEEPHSSLLDDSNRDAVVRTVETDAAAKRRGGGPRGLKTKPSKPGAHAANESAQQEGKRGRTSGDQTVKASIVMAPGGPDNLALVAQRTTSPPEDGDGGQKPGAQPQVGTTVASKKHSKKSNRKKSKSPNRRDDNPQRTTRTHDDEPLGSEDADVVVEAPKPTEPQVVDLRGDEHAHSAPPADPEHLIVAELVTEPSRSNVLVSAVQVDPNADDNKPIYKHKQFPKIMAAVCLVLIVIIIVVVAVVASGKDESGNSKDQRSPPSSKDDTPTPDYTTVEAKVAPWLDDPTQLQNEQSPYYEALQWLVYEDKMDPDAPNLQQRYVLAALYFATSLYLDWSTCAYVPIGTRPFCQYTVHSKPPSKGSGPPTEVENRMGARWLSDQPECTWGGITCSAGRVIQEIRLNEFRMNGVIPREIGLLTGMQHLDLGVNQGIQGSIPSSIGNLVELTTLDIEETALTGTLPKELCNALLLEELDLAENSLTGTLPSCLGTLTNLKQLALDKNDMTGTIPTELSQLVNLEEAEFNANEFTGSVPLGMCSLPRLSKLKVTCEETSKDGTFLTCDPSCDCSC